MRTTTGQSEPDLEKIRELEERLDNFRIQTANDLTIRGNAWQGYALNVPSCEAQQVSSRRGACCSGLNSHDCTITTESDCDGIYFGDGSTCDPTPCPAIGACCDPSLDGTCVTAPETNCIEAGWIYQGDDTTCDPNPCGGCPCPPTVDEIDVSFEMSGSSNCNEGFGDFPMSFDCSITDSKFGGVDFSATALYAPGAEISFTKNVDPIDPGCITCDAELCESIPCDPCGAGSMRVDVSVTRNLTGPVAGQVSVSVTAAVGCYGCGEHDTCGENVVWSDSVDWSCSPGGSYTFNHVDALGNSTVIVNILPECT